MMPTLGILDVGGKKYTLKYGESYVIGSMSEDYVHDIEINDKSVDIKHCVLDFTEQIPKIFDIKSKSGTFVDHERIPLCCMFPIKKSSSIQIGCVDAALQLTSEGDSGFLEDRPSPPIVNNDAEKDSEIPRAESATNVSNSDHPFLIPKTTAHVSRSMASSTTNESVDSFTIPETQAPPRADLPQLDDDEDSFYIPETQDANPILSNYPRLAFENGDTNETVADCDKIPSSQFRICTQDFNGSGDELSNHSDDVLANVPCSIVIPAIRHSPVLIRDTSLRREDSEIQKEMSALQWSKTSERTASNAPIPDGVCSLDDLVVPNQAQIEVPKQCSQCSTPDIFADNEPLLDDMEKSLKENDPPAIVGPIQQTQVFHMPSVKNASSTPNGKTSFAEQNVDKSPLPPTQLFVLPQLKTKSLGVPDKQQPASINDDDDLPPTQVFQPIPAVSKTKLSNKLFSSTLVDSEMQLSESSFKAKCNRLLDSDDDEMDEVVAPELVKKYRESLESAKDSKMTPPTVRTDNQSTCTPVQESGDNDKMLPPKNIPIQTPKGNPVASAQKPKSNNCDAKYVNIEDFLCTPDFLGREFTKDEDLQKKAEQNWKNQRKTLFQSEETPTKLVVNESDDSQDSFVDLLPHRKEQKVIVEKQKKAENNSAQKKPTPEKRSNSKELPAEEGKRIPQRRNSKAVADSKEEDKRVKKTRRVKRSTPKSDEKADDSSKLKKAKDSREEDKSRHKQHSESNTSSKAEDTNNDSTKVPKAKDSKSSHKRHSESNTSQKTASNLEAETDEKLAKENVVKQPVKRKTRQKSSTEKLGNPTPSKDDHNTPNGSKISPDNSKTNGLSEGKVPIVQMWTEKRTLEVVLNKNGAKKNQISMTKSSHKGVSDGGGRTRTKTKLSEVPLKEDNPIFKEPDPVIQKLPDTKEMNVSSQEKKQDVRKNSSPEQVGNKEAEKAKKRSAVKIGEADSVEVPQKRVTRLRSAKQTTDQPSDPKQVKTSRQTRGRGKSSKEPEKDEKKKEPENVTVDLTDEDADDRSKLQTTSSGVKRKNNDEDVEAKRTKSASSEVVKLTNRKAKTKPKIAMTMCNPKYQEVLEKHSGSLWVYTTDPTECDVLVLEKGNRTYKLLVAIARGIPVVKLDWLVEVLKRKTITVPMEEYIFEDQQFQERHQFLMKKSLLLAKSTSLFKDISFLMTPNIRPSPHEMKDIITCAGGRVLEEMPKDKQRIFLVSQSKDNQYWHQYRRSNPGIKIVTTEGVMASVMRQSEEPLVKSIIQ